MQISSAPKRGCVVSLEIPLLMRSSEQQLHRPPALAGASPTMHSSPTISQSLGLPADTPFHKVGLLGFDRPKKRKSGLPSLGKVLRQAYIDAGCEIVDAPYADLIVCNGDVEEMEIGQTLMENAKAEEIVFLTMPGHNPHPGAVAAAERHGKHVRRLPKPVLPSTVRQTLMRAKHHGPSHAPGTSSPGLDSLGRKSSFFSSGSGTKTPEIGKEAPRVKLEDVAGAKKGNCSIVSTLTNMWKPKGMSSEDAIACLSLGDYFSSRRKGSLHRSVSNASSGRGSSVGGGGGSTGTAGSTLIDTPGEADASGPASPAIQQLDTPGSEHVEEDDGEQEEEPEKVKVLVVEDNAINRKILVKILSSKLDIEIHEAQDGQVAIDKFRELSGPVVGKFICCSTSRRTAI